MNKLSMQRSPTNRGNRRLFSGVFGHKHKVAQLVGTALTLVLLAILLMSAKPSYAVTDIYTMNADGSNPTNITDNNVENYSPAWSPDGSKIAFARWGSSTSDIYVMNAGGSGQTKLSGTGDSDDFDPAWSPDGSKIAFARWGVWESDIYVMNVDGSNPINLTGNDEGSYGPAWSPDGSKIAFAQWGGSTYDIYVMNADGTGDPTNLTDNNADSYEPAWSPIAGLDGDKIAFTQWGAMDSDIYVINADGSNPTNLTNNNVENYTPAWSLDGTKIAFAQWGGWYSDIYVMNANGTVQTKLSSTGDSDDFDPAWSPDGSKIAFASSPNDYDDQSGDWTDYQPPPSPPPPTWTTTTPPPPPALDLANFIKNQPSSAFKKACNLGVTSPKLKSGSKVKVSKKKARRLFTHGAKGQIKWGTVSGQKVKCKKIKMALLQKRGKRLYVPGTKVRVSSKALKPNKFGKTVSRLKKKYKVGKLRAKESSSTSKTKFSFKDFNRKSKLGRRALNKLKKKRYKGTYYFYLIAEIEGRKIVKKVELRAR